VDVLTDVAPCPDDRADGLVLGLRACDAGEAGAAPQACRGARRRAGQHVRGPLDLFGQLNVEQGKIGDLLADSLKLFARCSRSFS
jgi:hypothetical protein